MGRKAVSEAAYHSRDQPGAARRGYFEKGVARESPTKDPARLGRGSLLPAPPLIPGTPFWPPGGRSIHPLATHPQTL